MQLAAGHHLYRTASSGWRLADDGGGFARVGGPDELLSELQGVLHGRDELCVASVEVAQQLVPVLESRRALRRPDASWAGPSRALVTGDNLVAAELVTALRRSDFDVEMLPLIAVDEDMTFPTPSSESSRDDRYDVVVSCADWLPDRAWGAVQNWCRRHGVAWHRVHVEGTRVFVGPMWSPTSGVSWHDHRGRLLAASRTPDDLQHHWAYLEDTDQPKPAVSWSAGVAQVACGLLLADLDCWRKTGRPRHEQVELEVLDDATVRSHPVLPLPEEARR